MRLFASVLFSFAQHLAANIVFVLSAYTQTVKSEGTGKKMQLSGQKHDHKCEQWRLFYDTHSVHCAVMKHAVKARRMGTT